MALRSRHCILAALLALCLLPTASACTVIDGPETRAPGYYAVYDLDLQEIVLRVDIEQKELGASCGLDNEYAYDGERFFVIGDARYKTLGFWTGTLYVDNGTQEIRLRAPVREVALYEDQIVYVWEDPVRASAGDRQNANRIIVHDIATGEETERDRPSERIHSLFMTGRNIASTTWSTEAQTRFLTVYDAIADHVVYDRFPLSDWDLPRYAELVGASDAHLYLSDHENRRAWVVDLPMPSQEGTDEPLALLTQDETPEESRPRAAPFISGSGGRVGIEGDHLYHERYYANDTHFGVTNISTSETVEHALPDRRIGRWSCGTTGSCSRSGRPTNPKTPPGQR